MHIEIEKLRRALNLMEGLAKPKVEKTIVESKKGKGKGKGVRTKVEHTWPILRNVLLKDGFATATDLDMAVMVKITEAVGQYLLPAKQVSTLLKSVPGNEEVTIEMKGDLVCLTWPDGEASYPTEKISSFPVIPEIQPTVKYTVNADLLVPNMAAMMDYCADTMDRPVLTGVILFLGEQLELAAGDGFRMAFKTIPANMPPSNGISTIIVPAKAVATLEHLWGKAPRPKPGNGDISLISLVANKGNIEIEVSPILIKFQFGSVALLAKTVQGTAPNFKQLIPKGEQVKLQVYAPDLERALRQLQVPTKKGLGAVRINWEMGKMKLALDTDEGNVGTSIPINNVEDRGRIAVSFEYLQEYIAGKSGLVTIGVTSPTAPVQFTHSQSPMVAIMPMQAMWPEDIQKQATAEAVEEAKVIAEASATNEASAESPDADKEEGEGEPETTGEEETEPATTT